MQLIEREQDTDTEIDLNNVNEAVAIIMIDESGNWCDIAEKPCDRIFRYTDIKCIECRLRRQEKKNKILENHINMLTDFLRNEHGYKF
ncbi:MAG: hypothetical protein WCE94_06605 [Candidatus Methanoperedens sp.]